MFKKVCKRCLEEKELEEFYRHPGMKDGHLNICKVCKREDSRVYGKTDRAKEYDRVRNLGEKRKAKRYERLKKWRRENPDKVREQRCRYPSRIKARNLVYSALKSGRLARLPCEICGSDMSEAHHSDYSRPLDVRWLCKLHHEIVHGRKVQVHR